jgi:hypothetical protein
MLTAALALTVDGAYLTCFKRRDWRCRRQRGRLA